MHTGLPSRISRDSPPAKSRMVSSAIKASGRERGAFAKTTTPTMPIDPEHITNSRYQFPWSEPAASGTTPFIIKADNASPTIKSESEINPVLSSEEILPVPTEQESCQPIILPHMRVGDICTLLLDKYMCYSQHRTERSAPGTNSSSLAFAVTNMIYIYSENRIQSYREYASLDSYFSGNIQVLSFPISFVSGMMPVQ
jgi:hypothetical protein